ncbi:MAG TPA: hypothetical protein PK794_08605, partial [Armatimonadota bacterium]|nr:hypothetical protein [Armatimonadota bacterium]
LVGLLLATARAANPLYAEQAAQARAQAPENRARVTAAMRAAGLPAQPIVAFAVPAMSDVMRLPYTYPEDGRLNGALRIVAARDEFEPASFLLYAFDARPAVALTPSPLRGPNGAVIPADQLDLKVVKVWFQNGNGWTSYFADAGLKLTPELLLHDENMVKVDTDAVANYARVRDGAGERFVWISAPRRIEAKAFDPVRAAFADAAALQPVALHAGEFKQFFLTAHVPADQPPGVYTGTVTVAERRRTLTEIPLALRVLPFTLPLPRTYFDLDREMVISFMGGATLSSMRALYGDEALARERYRQYLINQRNHGIFHPCVDQDEENFALLQALGFPTKPVMMGKSFLPWYGKNFGGRLTFDERMAAKKAAKRCADYYTHLVGHTDVLTSYGDEQGAAFVATHRDALACYAEYGIKIGCAGHEALLYKGGYLYDIHPMGGEPDAVERIRPWNEMGDKYVGFYASQHTGAENPQFIRRQHGLLGYLNNLSMVFNYAFALGPWNDLDGEVYKPMVVAYLNRGGLVDTLQWEGFREGVDDMRYATRLKLLARDAIVSGTTARLLEGKKALHYLALLNGAEMDLDVVRAEMIDRILRLMRLADEGGQAP